MKQRSVAQAEMGKKALGPLGLSLGGIYLGTNKEEEAFTLLCGACRSTFAVASHNPNHAHFNMTLAISMHMVNFNGTENVNRILQAEIQMQQHKTKEKHTLIRGSNIKPILKSDQSLHTVALSFSSFRSAYLHKFEVEEPQIDIWQDVLCDWHRILLLHIVFSRDVLFHFSVLYLGLILPKHALLGVSDLFGCILRLDNHSSQFDGLWSGYLDTTFNERPVTWEA